MAASSPIEGPRVVLEPFGRGHLTDRYVAWLNDPEVVRYSDQRHRAHSMASCEEYLRSFEGTPSYFWAIRAREAFHPIGTMTAYLEVEQEVADLGILIGERSAWGRGYASEAWRLACDFLFREAKVRKITAGTIQPNEPMVRLMRRAGMREDGRRVRHRRFEGHEVDVVHGALFREDWPAETRA